MKEFFTSVVGNESLRMRLGTDILNSSLPHALIFEGPRGTGKRTVSKAAAAALVCENRNDPTKPLPCLCCNACKKVYENKAADVITVGVEEKKATIGVDASRFIREDIHIIPNDFEQKIYIIEDADRMTEQAQNALLLSLEEPPAYVHFFLLCENAYKLLETIRSRAQILRTELLSRDKVDEYICSIDRRASQMKLSDKEGYEELLTAADSGGIGRALEYLDGRIFQPIKQRRELALDFLSAVLKQRGASETVPALIGFAQKREPLTEQLITLSEAVRDLITVKKSDTVRLVFFSDRDLAIELSDKASTEFLFNLKIAVETAIDELRRNANTRLCLINMAIRAHIF